MNLIDTRTNDQEELTFGNSFLDDTLGGIAKNDIILLGGKTGCGTTQLVTQIALENARLGKRVYFFALEAEKYEIERRIKYQLIANWFFKIAKPRPSFYLNYMDWYYGKLDKDLSEIEKEIDQQIASDYGTIKTFYRTGDFTATEFQRIALAIKDEVDLIIIDHLHYFDFEDENENRAMKDAVKKIRDTALLSGKPVILVSQLRKSDKYNLQAIPDLEDFHGSSDIGKIAVKAIAIAPGPQDYGQKNQRKTYLKVLKCRTDGARTNMTAMMGYNLTSQSYEQEYILGNVTRAGNESNFRPLDRSEIPGWAERAECVEFDDIAELRKSLNEI